MLEKPIISYHLLLLVLPPAPFLALSYGSSCPPPTPTFSPSVTLNQDSRIPKSATKSLPENREKEKPKKEEPSENIPGQQRKRRPTAKQGRGTRFVVRRGRERSLVPRLFLSDEVDSIRFSSFATTRRPLCFFSLRSLSLAPSLAASHLESGSCVSVLPRYQREEAMAPWAQ